MGYRAFLPLMYRGRTTYSIKRKLSVELQEREVSVQIENELTRDEVNIEVPTEKCAQMSIVIISEMPRKSR